jgi:hypothetical protein
VNGGEKIYVPINVYGAFRYVINKEKNISSTSNKNTSRIDNSN